jgi:glycosyltransferase involved in cell wall biosynthesis
VQELCKWSFVYMPIEASSPHKPTLALVSKTGPNGGGASMVACQLHNLLRREDSFSVDHWIGDANPTPPRVSLRGGWLGDLFFRASRVASRKTGYPDFANLTRRHLQSGTSSYGLYHVHDISGAVSPLMLSHWGRSAPLVWTLHDCSPFTGGCIYPVDCPAYLNGCGACPQLGRWPLQTSIDRTGRMLRYKLELIEQRVAAAICPSRWIADEAIKAGVREELLHVIHNAVDTSLFRPQNRQLVRRQLGLPTEGDIVVLASANFSNPYKGTAQGLQAIAAQKPGLNVLMIGQKAGSMMLPAGPNYLFRDFTSDRSLLATYYAASDLLLFPSLAENFSLVLIESMACGTPAIAFDTGGVGEVVEHEVNGWIAPQGDTASLAYGLKKALNDKQMREAWGRSAREAVLAKCSEQRFLQAHLDLYRKVLAENEAKVAAR